MEIRTEIVLYREATVISRSVGEATGLCASTTAHANDAEPARELRIEAAATSDASDVGIDLVLTLPDWKEGYVLVPGAVYDGNRFRVCELPYPPLYPDEEHDPSPVVADVPRLPRVHLLTGDASYPAVGLFDPTAETATVVAFPGKTDLGHTGLRIEEGDEGLTIRIQFPGVRHEGRYTMVKMDSPSQDRGASVGAGWSMDERVTVVRKPAREPDDLFRLVDEYRLPTNARVNVRPFSSSAGLVEEITMSSRWRESPGFFETADSDHGIPFQVGWTGGGITSFAMLASDDPLARQRARRNVDFVCEHLQGPSGFFFGGYWDEVYNDGFGQPHAEHWVMVRKSGDMLLFLLRHILALEASHEAVPEAWRASARACAEAFALNAPDWGQFVDARDGRVVVRGSACGGTALAGLALASQVLEEPRYLAAAEAAGARYGKECVVPGLLTGGPGEILKAPDSESAFGLVEGYVALWEATGAVRWLDLAARTARQAASWVVPYDFPFPEDSAFGRLGMRTAGTVVANVQNKHSAPGICTLSALSLLKLFRATGERRWLDLAVDVSHALPQYVSSAERPIPAYDGRSMPPGWVNERVNMSDWEEPECGVGEAFYGPCWSMASVLLTALEMPGVYVDPRRGIVACADHVEARIEDGFVRITNPTPYDAEVRVLVDRDPSKPLAEGWWREEPTVFVKAGGTNDLPL